MKTNLLKGAKSLLSIILAICLMVSVCSTGISFVASAADSSASTGSVLYWNTYGYGSDTEFAGSGSKDDPYIISTPAELYGMASLGDATAGKYYKVDDGITAFYMNSIAGMSAQAAIEKLTTGSVSTNWKNTYNYEFQGYFDGNGITIYGLHCSTHAAGLFPRAKNATIENVNIENSYFDSTTSGNYGAGAIVGRMNGEVTIKNCSSVNNKMVGTNAAGMIGTALGYAATISDCLVIADDTVGATILGTSYTSGFVGDGWTGAKTVKDSVAIGISADGNKSLTGLGITFDGVYSDTACRNTGDTGITVVTGGDNIKGAAARTAMPTLAWGLGWQTNEGAYPSVIASDINYVTWNGTSDTTFTTAADATTSSEADPFIIDSAEKLYGMVDSQGSSGAYFKVSDDIDVFLINSVYDMDAASARTYFADSTITKKAWLSSNSKTFNGTFDGNGATIVGLYGYKDDVTTTNQDVAVGFIPRVAATSATVKNIAFDKCYSHGASAANYRFGAPGIIFGCVRNSGAVATVENVQVTNSTVASTTIGGGLVVGTLRSSASLNVSNFVSHGNDMSGVGDTNSIGVFTGYSESGTTFTASNCILADTDIKATGKVSSTFTTITPTNVYTACTSSNSGTYNYTLTNTKGFAAYREIVYNMITQKSSAVNLDWDKTFMVNDRDYPCLKLFAYGGTDIDYAGGSGIDTDPYLIANAVDLHRAMFAAEGAVSYKLINDIEINPVKGMTFEDAKAALVTPWAGYYRAGYTDGNGYFAGDNAIIFQGTLDGDNHSIYGLYRIKSGVFSNAGGGLTGRLQGNPQFKDIAIRNSYLNTEASGRTAFFAVDVYNNGAPQFTNCAVVDSEINNTNTNQTAGFVARIAYGSLTFTNCLSDITITAPNSSGYGAFTGDATATYNNCIAKNNYFVNSKGETTTGITASTYTNCLTDYDIVGDGSVVTELPSGVTYIPSGDASAYDNSWRDDISYDTYLAKSTWGVDGTINPEDFTQPNYTWWDGTEDTQLDAWDSESTAEAGTVDNPYKITNAGELYHMVSSGGNGAYYKVADDVDAIYLNPVRGMEKDAAMTYLASADSNKWYQPAANTDAGWNGTFDGNGATIVGLSTIGETAVNYAIGFIPIYGENATVQNVHFDKFYVNNQGTTSWRAMAGLVFGCTTYTASASAVNYNVNVNNVIISNSNVSVELDNGNTAASLTVAGYRLDNASSDAANSTINVNITNVLAYDNEVTSASSGRNSFSVRHTSGGTGKVTVQNIVAAEETATYNLGVANNDYKAIYATSNLFTDATAKYTAITVDQAKGTAAVTAMTNLPWYAGWMPGDDGEYPYFGELTYDYTVWNGSQAQAWEGKGTKEQPYIIETAEQLYGMVKSGGKNGSYFKVKDGVTELYFNPVRDMSTETAQKYLAAAPLKKWNPATTDFNGHFDGNGVTLIGLANTAETAVGFIPTMNGGTADISDVHFDKCYFKSTSTTSNWRVAAAGVVVGGSTNGVTSTINLDKIIVSNSYTEAYTTAAAVIGGLGGNNTLKASNILTYGNTVVSNESDNYEGSVLGVIYTNDTAKVITVEIKNVLSADTVNVVSNQNDRHGEGTLSGGYVNTYENVYAVSKPAAVTADNITVITDANAKGTAVIKAASGLPWYAGWMPGETAESYPRLGSLDYAVWTGESVDFTEGDGTAGNPYIIENAEQLYKMVVDHGKKDDGTAAYYKVSDELAEKGIYLNAVKDMDATNSIAYMKEFGRNWLNGITQEKITQGQATDNFFIGHFDGNGATIYGMYASSDLVSAFIPNFGGGASVENVSFKHAYSAKSTTNASWWYGASIVLGHGYYAASGITVDAVNISKVRVEESEVYVPVKSTMGIIVGDTFSVPVNISTSFIAGCNTNADEATWLGTTSSNPGEAGSFVGNSFGGVKVTVSDSIALGVSVGSTAGSTKITFANTYSDTAYIDDDATEVSDISGVTVVTGDVKGEAAQATMPELFWGITWETAENAYPQFKSLSHTYWNGTAAYDWSGEGTKNDPYIIENAEQLYGMVQSNGEVDGTAAYFKVADTVDTLYLNPIGEVANLSVAQAYMKLKGANWSKNVTSRITDSSTPFVGKFDGNGVKIVGLYSTTTFANTHGTGVGFIPMLGDGAIIKNVHFDMPYVKAAGLQAAVVSTYMPATTPTIALSNIAVTNSHVENSDLADVSASTGNEINALETSVGPAGILNVYNSVNITIINCLYEGEVINNATHTYNDVTYTTLSPAAIMSAPTYTTLNAYINGCVAVVDDGVKLAIARDDQYSNFNVSNCYTTATDDSTNGVASVAKANLNKAGMPLLNWKYWEDAKFTIADGTVIPMPLLMEAWEFNNISFTDTVIADYTIFDGGNGSAKKPYGISTADQLYKAIFTGGQRYGTPLSFKLTADIDVTGIAWITSDITGYTAFIGKLNGDGHTIYGLNSATGTADAYAGLIPILGEGATVSNIHLENAYVYAANAGAIAGGATGNVTIEFSSVTNSEVSGTTAGGIIGSASSAVISDVFFIGTAADGLAGSGTPTITNAYTTVASSFESEANKVYANAIANGTITAETFGTDNWYQGNITKQLPRLKNQAAARECFDIDGDGNANGYGTDDLTSLKSKLLRKRAYNHIYADMTFCGGVEIRDLMVLRRTMVEDYADIDEGFWPNLAQGEYTIVYEEADNNDAAYELQRFFAEVAFVDVPVRTVAEHQAYITQYNEDNGTSKTDTEQIILVGDSDTYSVVAGDNYTFKLDMTYFTDGYYSVWFNSRYVTGVEELVDLFKQYAVYGEELPAIEGYLGGALKVNGETVVASDYKTYKQLKYPDGEITYNYVWGDEFDQDYKTGSTYGDGYDYNTWNIKHQKPFWGDKEVAMPQDIKDFNYISNGRLVMHNNTKAASYWAAYSGETSNGLNSTTFNPANYSYATGGIMTTEESMLFKRGYAELVAQVPNAMNAFPAWWLYGNRFFNNAGFDNSLYTKIYQRNTDYVEGTINFDPINPDTYKYKLPYCTTEIDIFEVMNTCSYAGYGVDRDYGSGVHKHYYHTVTGSTIYDTFGTGGIYTPDVNGYTREDDSSSTYRHYTSDENYHYKDESYQSYNERTYYFLWDEDKLQFWDEDNTTRRTINISGDNDFNVYLYMLIDNHIYTPGDDSDQYQNAGGVPTQDLIIDSVRLYQKVGSRAIITPDSKAINGTDN